MRHPRLDLTVVLALTVLPARAGEDALPAFDGAAVLAGRPLVSVSEPLVTAERRVVLPEKPGGLESLLDLFRPDPPPSPVEARLMDLPEPTLTTAPDLEAAIIDALIQAFDATGQTGAPLEDPELLAAPNRDGARAFASLHPGPGVAVNIRMAGHRIWVLGPGAAPLSPGATAHLQYGIRYSASLIDLATGDLLTRGGCEESRDLGVFDTVAPRAETAIDIAAIQIAESCIPVISRDILRAAGG